MSPPLSPIPGRCPVLPAGVVHPQPEGWPMANAGRREWGGTEGTEYSAYCSHREKKISSACRLTTWHLGEIKVANSIHREPAETEVMLASSLLCVRY